jgi:hypothetical protein
MEPLKLGCYNSFYSVYYGREVQGREALPLFLSPHALVPHQSRKRYIGLRHWVWASYFLRTVRSTVLKK